MSNNDNAPMTRGECMAKNCVSQFTIKTIITIIIVLIALSFGVFKEFNDFKMTSMSDDIKVNTIAVTNLNNTNTKILVSLGKIEERLGIKSEEDNHN